MLVSRNSIIYLQVTEFLEDEVKPVLAKYKDKLEGRVEFKL